MTIFSPQLREPFWCAAWDLVHSKIDYYMFRIYAVSYYRSDGFFWYASLDWALLQTLLSKMYKEMIRLLEEN